MKKNYRELIELRKKHRAFHNDRVIWLENSDAANVVTLMRLDQNDQFVMVINFSNRPLVGKVPVMNNSGLNKSFPKQKTWGSPFSPSLVLNTGFIIGKFPKE